MNGSTAALKRAVRQAVASAGGADAVAAGLSVSAQTVYRYGHPDHAEFPPLTSVVAIEAMGPSLHITAALAALQGAAVLPLGHAPAPATVLGRCAAVTREGAEVMEATAAAMADGEVSSAEAVRLAVEVAQLITAAQALLGKLKGEA
jgi:hypothetical protein